MAACAAHNLLFPALHRLAREQIGFRILWACSGWLMFWFGACALARDCAVIGASACSDRDFLARDARGIMHFFVHASCAEARADIVLWFADACLCSEHVLWVSGARGTNYSFACLSGALRVARVINFRQGLFGACRWSEIALWYLGAPRVTGPIYFSRGGGGGAPM